MLHEFLTQSRDEIVLRCARKLHARHPDRQVDELLDTIPQFLDEVIKAERREAGLPEDTPLPYDAIYARAHGEQRFRRGYKAWDLSFDFGAISDAIGELAIEHEVSLDPRSYRLLNECIDRAVAQSICEFFELTRTSGEHEMAEWVGSFGHELRNTVATAQMAYAAIKSGQVGLESRTSRILEKSLYRAEALIAQTIAGAQLRANVGLQRLPVDLSELVSDIVSGAPVERDVKVVVDVPSPMVICADPALLESAVSNLVQNALKYTRDRGTVTVRAFPRDTGATLEVSDECGGLQGRGDELFGAFVRGTRGKGVGLGLSITKQSIEAHGGHITVCDRAPVGCMFSVWLPGG